jgi:hypothetical protein
MVNGSATTKSLLQCHRWHDSAVSSSAGLDLDIAPWPGCLDNAVTSMTRHLYRATAKSPQQHRRQHDSTSISCRDQVATAALSPVWLDIYIVSRPSRPAVPPLAWLGSTVASMTRYLHHATVKSSRQRRCQYDSVSTSHHDSVAPIALC